MEYVVQACKVLKNLIHAEANARAQKTRFFVAFLTQTRFLWVITTELYLYIWRRRSRISAEAKNMAEQATYPHEVFTDHS